MGDITKRLELAHVELTVRSNINMDHKGEALTEYCFIELHDEGD